MCLILRIWRINVVVRNFEIFYFVIGEDTNSRVIFHNVQLLSFVITKGMFIKNKTDFCFSEKANLNMNKHNFLFLRYIYFHVEKLTVRVKSEITWLYTFMF